MLENSSAQSLIDGLDRQRGSVFHFTDINGLKGIITNGCLWASEATSMNDPEEVTQGWELIRTLVQAYPPGRARNLMMDQMPPGPIDLQGARVGVFILSASTEPSDYQWQKYGRAGGGYMIEINADVTLTLTEPRRDTTSDAEQPERGHQKKASGMLSLQQVLDMVRTTRWAPVFYDQATMSALIRECHQDLTHQLTTLEKDFRQAERITEIHEGRTAQDFIGEKYDELTNDVATALATLAHLYKNTLWKGEREVRVITVYRRVHSASSALLPSAVQNRKGNEPQHDIRYVEVTQAPEQHQGGILRRKPRNTLRATLPVILVTAGYKASTADIEEIASLLQEHGMSDVAIHRQPTPQTGT